MYRSQNEITFQGHYVGFSVMYSGFSRVLQCNQYYHYVCQAAVSLTRNILRVNRAVTLNHLFKFVHMLRHLTCTHSLLETSSPALDKEYVTFVTFLVHGGHCSPRVNGKVR